MFLNVPIADPKCGSTHIKSSDKRIAGKVHGRASFLACPWRIMNKEISLPPIWCSGICKNSMSDVCVEYCAVERNCEHFKVKPFEFDDLPPYPVEEFKKMTKQEKSYSLMIYTAKLTEKLQENENGQHSKIRQGNDYTGSCRIPKAVKK